MRKSPKIGLLTAISLLAAAMSSPAQTVAAPTAYVTPGDILRTAPAADWAAFDPEDLLVIDLARGGRVVIALADAFAPVHVANIRRFARAGWYDGLSIERVQDNYVVQWGDPDGAKPLPANVTHSAPAEYDRAAAGLAFHALAYRDTYAQRVGSAAGLPVAEEGDRAWLVHCYGMVGVGRDLNPDTGTGAELYAVIGQPPRALDRNIAVVGRVLAGMDILAALPRGTADLGFYADPGQRLPIQKVRIAADMPVSERPRFERLKAESPTFDAWSHARANRKDTFFLRPAGALDVCNAEPPVRVVPGA
jgi:peptidylprolyl isomerase